VDASGQSGMTIAAHAAAAQAAAGETWLTIESELCGPAQGGLGRLPAVRVPGTPPRAQWYHDPVKIFDNLYLFSSGDVNSMALRTSAGIILFDATYDYMSKELITDAMPKVGLDPKQIKYLVLTHYHGDHAAGAKYIVDTYGPRVLMSEADWTEFFKPVAPGGSSSPMIKKDMVITDGQKLTLGDTTVTLWLTPGHTPGSVSPIFPVFDKGKPHVAAIWGGTAVALEPRYPGNLVEYSASARRFRDVAAKAGVDAMLSNHERYGDVNKRVNAMLVNPAGPNPFILGSATSLAFMDVLDHCTQALALAAKAKPPAAK
jgi:metallo-beta-lactamase class B